MEDIEISVKHPKSEWNPERVQVLIDAWLEGASASEIGRRLNISRSAAMGKVYRLRAEKKLDETVRPKRPAPVPRPPRKKKQRLQPRGPVVIVPVEPPKRIEGGVSIMDLQHHHCRAVIGKGPDGLARFCGEQISPRMVAGRVNFPSWCKPHCDEYTTPATRR